MVKKLSAYLLILSLCLSVCPKVTFAETTSEKIKKAEELKKEIPADRIGSAEEAAQMIVNVLEAPDYMTGQIITMDGGWISCMML